MFNIDKNEMRVKKRNGSLEDVSFDKILERVKRIGNEVNIQINYSSLVMKVIHQLYDKIETSKIDELTSEQCNSLSSTHPDYGVLASRIVISNHQKKTDSNFTNVMEKLYYFTDFNKKHKPFIKKELYDFSVIYSNEINAMINYDRDYLIDYFGFKTLEHTYLFRVNDVVIERIQHLWMRVAVGLHYDGLNVSESLQLIKETYDLISMKYFIHATPTLFNIGTNHQQLSSCFLVDMEEDSIAGIYSTLKDCAVISKHAGGIGLNIHSIRGKDSAIHGTNGKSNGIVPMLRNFNETANYCDQGGGKRKGSFAIYLETWHSDIEAFLDMRKNHGDEKLRARDLFYALWVCDLFMERVKSNEKWSLFCPNECKGLCDVYGDDFKELYEKYESNNLARKTIQARDLWFKILDAQMETGTPYLVYKDASNKKSNQQNVGTIKSSNLCAEIIEYSSKEETAVCNLASIALPSFVKEGIFDYEKLHQVVKVITNNLNKIIDINYYPTDKTRRSNLRHRPLGIGVQGLADTFILMDMAFHSSEAREVNKQIFETIYHASLEKSNELAIRDGCYETFNGSPASKGILQFDLWKHEQSNERYDWISLKRSIQTYGIRNSLLVALMPTASTSQILGFNECIEPFTSNLYSRRTLAGEFIVVNKYLVRDLLQLGLWNEDIKNNIILNKGSVQQLSDLPEHIRNKYKIVWEMPMRHIIDMSADRGLYVCQSQSLNLWVEDPNYNILTSMHFHAWSKGLKTGIYYLRRKAKHQAQQFTIEPEQQKKNSEKEIEKEEPCLNCSA